MTGSESPEREGEYEEVAADRRRLLEFLAGGMAVVILMTSGVVVLYISEDKGAMIAGAGFLVLAAGLTLVLSRIERRHSRVERSPSEEDDCRLLVQRLDAEREMLRTSWRRNTAPLLPGLALIFIGIALAPVVDWHKLLGAGAAAVCLLGWLEWQNRQAARRLSQEIGNLKRDSRGPDDRDA